MPTYTFVRTDWFYLDVEADTKEEAIELAGGTSALDEAVCICQGEWVLDEEGDE
jgi:hypothetical protein